MSCLQPDEESGAHTTRPAAGRPVHNWRPTVVHGALSWLVLGLLAALPLGAPLELGVAVAGVLVAPVLPVALWCDYRQARRYNECTAGVAPYLKNLVLDVRTTLRDREPLGSARTRPEC